MRKFTFYHTLNYKTKPEGETLLFPINIGQITMAEK